MSIDEKTGEQPKLLPYITIAPQIYGAITLP